MQCNNCGAINSDDSAFCDSCGQRLQPAPVTPQPVVPAPAVRSSVPRSVPVKPATPKRRKIPWYIFALAAATLLLCLVVVGVAVYLIFRDTTSTIAYAVNYSDEVDPGLYLMDDDGQNARLLVAIDAEEEEISHLSWSPNGKSIAYMLRNNDEQYSIWVVAIKTGETTPIVEDFDPAGYPSYKWSPNNQLIAYIVLNDAHHYSILVTEIKTSETTPIIKNISIPSGTTFYWTPDSQQIAYTYRSDEIEIRIVNIDGSDDSLLTSGAIIPSSQDGDAIVYYVPGDHHQIALIRPDGSEKTILWDDPELLNGLLAWSADKKWILFPSINYSEKNTEIWLLSIDGVEQINLTDTPETYEHRPSFSPDGRWIAYLSCDDLSRTECDLKVIHLDGFEQKYLDRHVYDLWPSWSPDSKSVIYSSEDGEIIQVEIASGQKTTLTDAAIYADWLAYQP